MATYGLIINGVVAALNDQAGYDQATRDGVHDRWTEIPDGTQLGATKVGGAWKNPPGGPAAVALTPMAFYLAFTPAERIAIKGSEDPMVKEFWATYELAVQTGSLIDMGLVSVTGGLEYLSSRTPALIAADRIPQIIAGEPQ